MLRPLKIAIPDSTHITTYQSRLSFHQAYTQNNGSVCVQTCKTENISNRATNREFKMQRRTLKIYEKYSNITFIDLMLSLIGSGLFCSNFYIFNF